MNFPSNPTLNQIHTEFGRNWKWNGYAWAQTNSTAILPVANGGTGVSTSTGTGSVVRADSPALTGTPTSTTQAKSDGSTKIATTSFVKQQFYTSGTGGVLDWNDGTNTIPGVGPTLLLGNATNGPSGIAQYYHALNLEYGGIAGTGNVSQLAIPYGNFTGELYLRGRYQGAWTSWARFLSSTNFNSFAPTLSGTGATGTWGIGISGTAANATTAVTVTGTQLGAAYHSLTAMASAAAWAQPAGYQTMVNVTGSNASGLPTGHGQLYFGYCVTSKRDSSGGYSALLTAYDNSNLWFTYGQSNASYPVWRKIWHDGNDGTGSTLDADLLDGQQGSFYQDAGNLNAGVLLNNRLAATQGAYTIDPTIPATNAPHTTLGAATIGELAVSNAYSENKIQFKPPISIEYTTDGTNWSTYPDAVSSTTIKNIFLGYNAGSTINIRSPNNGNWVAVRMVFEATSYCYLNYLYFYNATQGHTCNVKIEKGYGTDVNNWSEVGNGNFSSWPGHTMMPHAVIPFHPTATPGSHSKYVRLTFTPAWSGTYPANNIIIYSMNWYGQYPAVSQPYIYTWDFDRNVTFPASVTVSGGGTFNGNLSGNSSTATTAVHLSGGVLGSMPYQGAASTTGFIAPNITTAKQFLSMTGTGAAGAVPIWGGLASGDITGALGYTPLSTELLANRSIADANTADTVGVAVHYLSSGATNKPTGTDHALLTLSYSSSWSMQFAGDWRTNILYMRNQNNGSWGSWLQIATTDGTIAKATNLTGGVLGSIHYQSAVDASAILAPNISTTKQFLSMTGSGVAGDAPVWSVVSKADLDLANVENTALSTWAGTANITTLGTIATGIWNGTVIADNKIATALTGKTYNGLTLTAAATGWTMAGGTTSKTLTVNNTVGLSGTDGSTLNISTGGTLGTAAFTAASAYATAAQTFYIGTTQVAINRGSASLTLNGVNIDGSAGSASVATYLNAAASSAVVDNITTRVNSGFFETSSATTAEGWPATTNSYYHLLSSTHSNGSNYYAMQFAGDFYTNTLYYRSTNGSGTAAWSKVILDNNLKTINGSSIIGSGDLAVGGPARVIRSARTSNTALAVSDLGTLIDITSGTFTQTFVAVATLGSGWWCYMRNSGTGDITLDPNSTEQIDGLTSFIMYPGEVRLIQCDGTALRSIVISGFSRTFTASGTFTKPPGYVSFGGLLWGGGGSGGHANFTDMFGAGGGGGCCNSFFLQASVVGSTETVTIGAGGAARAIGSAGVAGGNSSFGSLVLAFGGGGGAIGGSSQVGGGGGGGHISAGDNGVTTTAGIGGSPSIATGNQIYGGGGGSANQGSPGGFSWFGGGGGGGTSSFYASAGGSSQYGGGGGGGGANSSGAGGSSLFGGNWGIGSSSGSNQDTSGVAPGGGGGGVRDSATYNQGSTGAGARGELRIWGNI
jgi:hypothetical protein